MPRELLNCPLTVRPFAEEITPTPSDAAFSGISNWLPPHHFVILEREEYRQCNRDVEAKQLN